MFEIGWAELLVIGVVALIVIGPKDLPEMFRTLGRMTAKARNMAREFQRAMESAADESGVKDIAKDLRSATSAKSMGLDAVKDAAARFESWDPLKATKAAPPRGPATQAMAEAQAAKKAAASVSATPQPAAAAPAAPQPTPSAAAAAPAPAPAPAAAKPAPRKRAAPAAARAEAPAASTPAPAARKPHKPAAGKISP